MTPVAGKSFRNAYGLKCENWCVFFVKTVPCKATSVAPIDAK